MKSLPAGENAIYIKTIKTINSQGILPKNTLDNCKVVPTKSVNSQGK